MEIPIGYPTLAMAGGLARRGVHSVEKITVQRLHYEIAEQHVDGGQHVEQAQNAHDQVDVFEHFECVLQRSERKTKLYSRTIYNKQVNYSKKNLNIK